MKSPYQQFVKLSILRNYLEINSCIYCLRIDINANLSEIQLFRANRTAVIINRFININFSKVAIKKDMKNLLKQKHLLVRHCRYQLMLVELSPTKISIYRHSQCVGVHQKAPDTITSTTTLGSTSYQEYNALALPQLHSKRQYLSKKTFK